jgi:hypothetical protein
MPTGCIHSISSQPMSVSGSPTVVISQSNTALTSPPLKASPGTVTARRARTWCCGCGPRPPALLEPYDLARQFRILCALQDGVGGGQSSAQPGRQALLEVGIHRHCRAPPLSLPAGRRSTGVLSWVNADMSITFQFGYRP